MSYQFDFENPDAASYDRRSGNGASGGVAGGLTHTPVGSFGMDRPAPEPVHTVVLRKVNPNFMFGGLIAVGGMGVLTLLVTSLGQANPNNQMLETSNLQAEAFKTMIESQSQAMQAVANQRPACIALVCNTSEPRQSEPQYEAPVQSVQQMPTGEGEGYSESPSPVPSSPSPSATPTPLAVPTDATTVSFWLHHMNDQAYIDRWHQHCAANWDTQPECQALRVALINQFANQ